MSFLDIHNNQGRGRGYKRCLVSENYTLIILDIAKTESNNCFIIYSCVLASSLTGSNTKRASLTSLPLQIMHRGHT